MDRPKSVILRTYCAADEEGVLDVWLRAWKVARSDIDFEARLPKFTEHLGGLAEKTTIAVALCDEQIVGAVTIDRKINYLDQLFVAPEYSGQGVAESLIDWAKILSPQEVRLLVNEDNLRAIRFYEKHDFVRMCRIIRSEDNTPLLLMRWIP